MPKRLCASRQRIATRTALVAAVLVVVSGCSGSGSSSGTLSAADGVASSTTSGTAPTTAAPRPATASPAPTNLELELERRLDPALSVDERYDRLIKSVIVTVGGRPVYEHYSADSGPDVTHNGYSVTKSVMSMLIGIAIDEGSIAGLDQTLAELLPSHVPIMAPGVAEVTLEQVLTMTGGIQSDELDPFRVDAADWVTDFLSTPLEQPAGTSFRYSSRGSHLLSAILTEATGRSPLDFAREKLFDPLGISTEPADQRVFVTDEMPDYDTSPGFGWATDPQGLNIGGFDLRITAPDMVTLGLLHLDGGQWQGSQVVSADWVATSTTNRLAEGDSAAGYGYQWWVFESAGHPAYAAVGFAGQLIQIVPDLDLVVAVSCLDDPARFDAESFVSMVETSVIPALAG